MKKFVGRAVAMMAAHPGPFSLFWVTTLLQLAYKVGTAFCARVIFDDGITHGNSRALAAALGVWILLLVVFAGAAMAQERVMARLGTLIGNGFRRRLFEKQLSVSPQFHRNHGPSDLVDRMGSDVGNIELALVRGIPTFAARSHHCRGLDPAPLRHRVAPGRRRLCRCAPDADDLEALPAPGLGGVQERGRGQCPGSGPHGRGGDGSSALAAVPRPAAVRQPLPRSADPARPALVEGPFLHRRRRTFGAGRFRRDASDRRRLRRLAGARRLYHRRPAYRLHHLADEYQRRGRPHRGSPAHRLPRQRKPGAHRPAHRLGRRT